MSGRRIITITTDFGMESWFVGTMKGAIKRICPDCELVDITHNIRRFNVHEAAFSVLNSYPYFPRDAIHVVVVDPGVGSSRIGMAAESSAGCFVGPDNGVFSYVTEREKDFRAAALENPKYMLPEVSSTFHGRDIFAPAAAHLALGVPLGEFGPVIEQPIRLKRSVPARLGDRELVGHIIYIDHFGNCISDLRKEDVHDCAGELPRRIKLSIRDNVITRISSSYSEGREGELICLFGSSGFLEFGVYKGNAEQQFTIEEGGEFILKML